MEKQLLEACLLGVPMGAGLAYLHYNITQRFEADHQYTISDERMISAVVILLIAIAIAVFDEAPYMLKAIGIAIAVFLLYWSFRAKMIFCANCGYYHGTRPRSCPRCGHNVWTYSFRGVGDTYREGPKNY